MASLNIIRGEKRYVGSVMVKGKRKTRLFTDHSQQAKRACEKWEDETRERMKARGKDLTLSFLFSEYLEDIERRVIYKTYRQKRAILNRFRAVLSDLTIDRVNPVTIRKYLLSQKQRPGGAKNEDLKNLSTAWKWGIDNIPYFPGENPFQKIQRYPKEKKNRYVPPESDFWKVYEVATSEQDRVMLLMIFETAARPVEIFRLKFTDLDFDNNKIQLWSRKIGKNHDYMNRWVPMSEKLKNHLLNWMQKRKQLNINSAENVFISQYFRNFGDSFEDRRYFMKELCRKADVKRFGLYGLRHLRATIEYSKDKNIRSIQKLLGHQKASTTDHYLQQQGLDMVAGK